MALLPATLQALAACASGSLPADLEREELGARLRELSLGPSDPLLGLAERLSSEQGASDLSALAAEAMRVLMQRRQGEPRATDEGSAADEPSRTERRRRDPGLARQARDLKRSKQVELVQTERPVETLPGVGAKIGLALRAKGIHCLGDLVFLLPLGYHDERAVTPIAELRVGEYQVTEGEVVSARSGRARGRGMAEVIVRAPGETEDSGARLRLTWFRVPGGLLARFRQGERFRISGTVDSYRGELQVSHPQTEHLGDASRAAARGIRARYPVVPGVAPRLLATAIRKALDRCLPSIPEAVPEDLRVGLAIERVSDALRALHTPPADLSDEQIEAFTEGHTPYHERLALEEFFLLELSLHRRRVEEQGVRAPPLPLHEPSLERARGALGFELTESQRRVSREIAGDLEAERPMRRLLQGDVGSGKTAVAMLAAAQAIARGGQVAFMAPTEVLAEQHFRSLLPLAQAMGLRCALVLGGERAAHRKRTRKGLEDGTLDLAVGTHALLNEGVCFASLALVIVDEQHRFGVGQRLRLVGKGARGLSPHLLVMTATPIPRSLTLALHGDLSASVLSELPPGRVPPVTRAYRGEQREQALHQLERALQSGGQAFVVCPAIEPNEETAARSTEEVYAELCARLASYGVGLLHGRLPPERKQAALERFLEGQDRVLVTTTVIEVGVDVARANVILIEDAHRFGLAQLHQLRGRVGRDGQRSACLLVHDAVSDEARSRIRTLCECSDGFRIAEQDLRLRGPGELFGRRQSGLPGFRFGDLRRDAPLLEKAQALASQVIARDPELLAPEQAGARRALLAQQDSERALVKEEAG